MPRMSVAAAALLSCLSLSTAARAELWEIDPDHSDVGFTVRHMMVSNVRGAFHQVAGTLDYDAKDASKSKLNVTVTVSSVDTRVQKRDDHLRSPDFFDAAKFPNITFQSTAVKKKGKKLEVTGDLTIRDVKKAVTLTVEGPAAPVKDPFGMTRTAVSATGKISRKDFGLTWNKALETGGALVGDDVNIDISAEFTKKEAIKPEAPKADDTKP